jgi:hypothetical protein
LDADFRDGTKGEAGESGCGQSVIQRASKKGSLDKDIAMKSVDAEKCEA